LTLGVLALLARWLLRNWRTALRTLVGLLAAGFFVSSGVAIVTTPFGQSALLLWPGGPMPVWLAWMELGSRVIWGAFLLVLFVGAMPWSQLGADLRRLGGRWWLGPVACTYVGVVLWVVLRSVPLRVALVVLLTFALVAAVAVAVAILAGSGRGDQANTKR
jgi:hypothetical protein